MLAPSSLNKSKRILTSKIYFLHGDRSKDTQMLYTALMPYFTRGFFSLKIFSITKASR